jgi:hypothetical protein
MFAAPLHSNGNYSIVGCVFVAPEMCLPSRCLAMNVSSDFVISAFGRHVTIITLIRVTRDPVGQVLCAKYHSCCEASVLGPISTASAECCLSEDAEPYLQCFHLNLNQCQSHVTTYVSRSVSLSVKHPSGAQDQIFVIVIYDFVDFGRPLTRGRVCHLLGVIVSSTCIYICSFACRHSTQSFVMHSVPCG